jgi:hypothetical protein
MRRFLDPPTELSYNVNLPLLAPCSRLLCFNGNIAISGENALGPRGEGQSNDLVGNTIRCFP